MSRASLLVGVLGFFALSLVNFAEGQDKKNKGKKNNHHPHLHHALNELKESQKELRGAKGNFGGHLDKALKDIRQAIDAIEDALQSAGDPFKGKVQRDANDYKKYAHHPHIHHALHDLREAKMELKNASHNFGGKRDVALREVNQAIDQLQLILKHAK